MLNFKLTEKLAAIKKVQEKRAQDWDSTHSETMTAAEWLKAVKAVKVDRISPKVGSTRGGIEATTGKGVKIFAVCSEQVTQFIWGGDTEPTSQQIWDTVVFAWTETETFQGFQVMLKGRDAARVEEMDLPTF